MYVLSLTQNYYLLHVFPEYRVNEGDPTLRQKQRNNNKSQNKQQKQTNKKQNKNRQSSLETIFILFDSLPLVKRRLTASSVYWSVKRGAPTLPQKLYTRETKPS